MKERIIQDFNNLRIKHNTIYVNEFNEIISSPDNIDLYLEEIKLFHKFKKEFIKKHNIINEDFFNSIIEQVEDNNLKQYCLNIIDYFDKYKKLVGLL